MMESNELQFPKNEKELSEVRCRLTKSQRKRLETLAEMYGYTTLSSFMRDCFFKNDIHHKLNLILEKLDGVNKNEKGKHK